MCIRDRRYTNLERVHLSYCENIHVPAIFWLTLRTYAPHLVPETVRAWKASVRAQSSQKQQELADRIGEPHTMPELFPEGGYT